MSKTRPPSASGTRSRAQRGRKVEKRKRALWLWIVGAVVILGVAAPLIYRMWSSRSTEIAGVIDYPNQVRDHNDQPQTYAQTPPVGGVHSSVWQNCGVYNQPIRNENGVHALEHGAAWITYQPDLAVDGVQKLREAAGSRSYTLLSPYPGLTSPVVASAWGLQLTLSDPGDPRLAQFIANYAQGPQTPEPGAPCSGGTRETVEQ